ncbi:MAG: FAD-dependent oxidoreductase [Candidatus Viridilinea halotolerans]|uniref:FAD-dependent oxidoreductase n=1 Tax=Candidatus Viridilinea halotolerans TaxID=2491704 RepID=A0A426TTB4_9CHLR|nr:MAG: FAD-dependent oxidoreductase [Candidatus Viridilinea halotolerans]
MQREIRQTQIGSIWYDGVDLPTYSPLATDLRSAVAIVGAGIAGLSTAYQLAKRGFQVAVFDDGPISGGDTGNTTAQLTCMLDKGYAATEQLRDVAGARLAAESHMAAIDVIERIARDEAIACDFARMDGYLFLAPGDELRILTEERDAARRAGLSDVTLINSGVALGNVQLSHALRFPHQAHFHPLKYLAGLCHAIERMGGQIFCGTHITRVHAESEAIIMLETTDGPVIRADSVVLATHMPINDTLGYSLRIAPALTYVVGLHIPTGSLPNFLAFDTADPYHYVRIQAAEGHDVLIVGGEDHKTGQADDMEARYQRLAQWARVQFPQAGEVLYRWSGQVANSFDGLALLGHDLVSPHVYVITGQTGIGMTHSTIGSLIIADQIAGIPNRWAELYAPGRATGGGLGEVIGEGLNVLSQYTELLKGGDVDSATEIPVGSGAVVGWGPKKLAVYRDDHGMLHRRSALCTHLGCVVAWNDSAKTWDCPCHGSRFDSYGTVINGPAPADLSPAEE